MKLTEAEERYLDKIRELAAKNREIVGVIANMKRVCESLCDWQQTAADLASPDGASARDVWSADKIAALIGLQKRLVEYDQLMKTVETLWENLEVLQKDGLASPDTLKTPKVDTNGVVAMPSIH
jgi:hypothetical protein